MGKSQVGVWRNMICVVGRAEGQTWRTLDLTGAAAPWSAPSIGSYLSGCPERAISALEDCRADSQCLPHLKHTLEFGTGEFVAKFQQQPADCRCCHLTHQAVSRLEHLAIASTWSAAELRSSLHVAFCLLYSMGVLCASLNILAGKLIE